MLAQIRQVLDKIRHGKNIDLYLGITLSLIVGGLGILGIASSELVSSLTLAVLAFVCVSFLKQRRQNTQIMDLLEKIRREPTADDFFVQHDLASVQKFFKESETVCLRGVTLQSNIPIFEEAMKRGLSLGRTYRALLADPSGKALDVAAHRWPSFKRADFVRDLEKNIGRLKYLRETSTKGSLEARTIDDLGPYLVYIFNGAREDGALMVRLQSRDSNDERPTFWVYRKRDPYWFDRFVAEFEQEWAKASSAFK